MNEETNKSQTTIGMSLHLFSESLHKAISYFALRPLTNPTVTLFVRVVLFSLQNEPGYKHSFFSDMAGGDDIESMFMSQPDSNVANK